MWVLPTTLEEEDISNQYQWGSSDMVNIHLTKEDIEDLSVFTANHLDSDYH